MKGKLLVLIFLAGTSLFAGPRVFVGIGLGYPPAPVPMYAAPPPPPVVAYAPVRPYPGYTWVSGYYYPVGPRWVWRPGYWTRPPHARARWVAPRYFGGRYYGGYWRR
jgi:hypothetical protein